MRGRTTRVTPGFTLIELLVVIGVITLLLAILMPAINRSKRQANAVRCQAHLRQWAVILAAYAEDNNGSLFSGSQDTGYWWIVELDERYKDWVNMQLWFCPTATRPLYNERGQLNGRPNTFSAWGIFKGDGLGPNGIAGSYAINAYVLNTTVTKVTPFEGGRDARNNWRNINVKGSNQIPLFLDALRFDLWPLDTDVPPMFEDMPWSSNHMDRCCINRHDGYVNAAFLDFTVRRVGLKELWTLKWHRKFDTCGLWTKRGGVTRTDWPDWMQKFEDY